MERPNYEIIVGETGEFFKERGTEERERDFRRNDSWIQEYNY